MRNGFTLVELSIVLVIIGLIVGGVLVGRDLINAAELRTVIKEVESYQTAIKTFRLKYDCLPGDCASATSLGLGTNGNGNGIVDEGWCGTSVQDGTVGGNVEQFRFWLHMGNSQLIAGNNYTGAATSGFMGATIGVNVPASKISNGGYSLLNAGYAGTQCSSVLFSGAIYTNSMFFGANMGNDRTGAPLLKTLEAYNIDQKIDDGLPGIGRVIMLNNSWYSGQGFGSANCVTTNSPSTAVYNLATTTRACHLIFSRVY